MAGELPSRRIRVALARDESRGGSQLRCEGLVKLVPRGGRNMEKDFQNLANDGMVGMNLNVVVIIQLKKKQHKLPPEVHPDAHESSARTL